jgi:spore coat polysaccharide biosynthesis predicted glycosyltransferase SpsG
MPIFSVIAKPYEEKKNIILLRNGRNISKLLRECIVAIFAGFHWQGKSCRNVSTG